VSEIGLKAIHIADLISKDQITLYVSIPISRKLNEFARGIKSRMTFYIKRELPELFNFYKQYKKQPIDDSRPMFWSGGTFIIISSQKAQNVLTIQTMLESFLYKPDFNYIDSEIERIKHELTREYGTSVISINRNSYLLYKIQTMRSKINETYYLKHCEYLFEMTPRAERYALVWSFFPCTSKIQLNEFLRETESYIRESLFSTRIVDIRDLEAIRIINALRIDAAHDVGTTYDARTLSNIKIVKEFYTKIIGKLIPNSQEDYFNAQSGVLMLVLGVMLEIDKKYCS
jgi:hypothetical protein